MTQRRYATRSTTTLTSPCTTTVQRHQRGAATSTHPLPRSGEPIADIDEILLEAAELVLTQLRVLRTLVASPSEARRLVVDVHESAVAHGTASAGAIGVTAVLADLLACPDEYELAATLHRAHHAFGDHELVNGAAAMLAATSGLLGRLMDLDPTVVGDEIARHRLESAADHRSD